MIFFLGEIEEEVGDCGIVRDEPTVEVGKVKEQSYILNFGWGGPGSDAVEFDWVYDELTRFYNHSKVFYLRDVELTLLELQVKVESCHALEDMMGPFLVDFWVGGGNEEVVHIDDEPSFSDHVSKQVVHEPLECGGGVAKTKEHDGGFKESLVGDEGHLPLMTIFDVDVVVPPTNIKLSEVVSVFQLVHEVGDEGKRVGVTGGVFVEVPVILTRMKFAILLFDEEKGGGLWRVGMADLSSG